MIRILTPLALLFASTSDLAAQPRDLQILQEAVRKVIGNAEPSVACILVSRSERYRDFNALPAGPTGKLGSFDARPYVGPFAGDLKRQELLRRLDLANPDPVPESYGSGVVIDAGGLILTHFHVVQNATKIFVRLPGKKGSYADIHAADGRSDLAVLKLINPPADLTAIRFGDGGKAQKGDFVVGIANPFAAGFRDGGPTASHGIIGNLRRRAPSNGLETDRLSTLHHLGTLMQTDLRLNLGCSGGAVMNLDGEMIALTSSMAAIVGGETPGGFAVPMDANMKRIINVLRQGREVEYGFLGVGVDSLNPVELQEGAVIHQVSEGTPAKRAGLLVGETILAVNDVPIKDNNDLFLNVGAALAGSEVTLTVQAFGGRNRKTTLKLAKFPYPGPVIAANGPPTVYGLRVDYNSMVNTDLPIPEGVWIRDVERNSSAEKKYKELLERSRWIVVSVNGKAIATPADFHREVAAAKSPLDLRIVEVVKNPETTTRTLTFP
ncbi:MAG: trypsin-like peptidase domain-containing protein [Planctomycetes bacterium]|nr:trypsin-like peptidase domain-containing protein [Planctomycetota bacterium]